MTSRTLKIVLAVSVALNLFAAAAAVTTFVGRAKVEKQVEAAQTPPGRNASFRQVLSQMDPQVRERVRTTLRASAMAARPDFEQARGVRRQAVALSGSPDFDAAKVKALLDQSRSAEMRGRARLEADAVQLLSTLEADDRKALAQILSRRGRNARPQNAARPEAPAPAVAPAQ